MRRISLEERRAAARLHFSAMLELETPLGPVTVEVRDISSSGARVWSDVLLGDIGGTLDVGVGQLSGGELMIGTEIVRIIEDGGGYEYGLSFDVTEPAKLEAIVALTQAMLDGWGTGTRHHRRVTFRREIYFGEDSRYGIVDSMSEGGLSMAVEQPLDVGSEFDLAVPDNEGVDQVLLRGRVVYVRPLEPHEGRGEGWHAGIEFVSMRRAARDWMLRVLMQRDQDD